MLMVKLEMWPRGDASKAYSLGTIAIANAGTGSETQGDYSVQLSGRPEHFKRRGNWREGLVKAFPRKRLGAYDLLLRALIAVIADRNPAAHAAFRKTLERIEREGPPEKPSRGPMTCRCRQCNDITEHRHLHDTAHGVPGTHMAGSERFRCNECGCTTYAADNIGDFRFVYDKAQGANGG